MAKRVSPPPAITFDFEFSKKSINCFVPFENWSISKIPSGPFQIIYSWSTGIIYSFSSISKIILFSGTSSTETKFTWFDWGDSAT